MSDENENASPETRQTGTALGQDGPVTVGPRPLHADDLPDGVAPEDLDGEIGAEGGSQSANNHTPTPFHPAKDGTAWGDTDQHSNA